MESAASDTKVAPPAFTVPRELEGHARYLVLAPLGAGGMGTVYKARHRLMERVVALKIVNPLLVNKPGAVERFTREVKAAAQLVHPNIVTAYDAEKVGDLHLLVMEFVEGQTLAQVLAVAARAADRPGLRVPSANRAGLAARPGARHGAPRHQAAEPDAAVAERRGCGRVSIRTSTVIKILDFGLARFVSEQAPSDGATEAGTLMGSPDYMAPEQGHDAHAADARADIYGMGCTLYHLLAGQVPFPATSLLGETGSASRQATDPAASGAPRGAGRAGQGRRENDGEGPGPAVSDARGGRRGAAAVHAGRARVLRRSPSAPG